jgi:hypothetical protein
LLPSLAFDPERYGHPRPEPGHSPHSPGHLPRLGHGLLLGCGRDLLVADCPDAVVVGLIIGCVSAIGTLLSGWGTFVTARAMARQDQASRAPRARAKSTRPRTRKRK